MLDYWTTAVIVSELRNTFYFWLFIHSPHYSAKGNNILTNTCHSRAKLATGKTVWGVTGRGSDADGAAGSSDQGWSSTEQQKDRSFWKHLRCEWCAVLRQRTLWLWIYYPWLFLFDWGFEWIRFYVVFWSSETWGAPDRQRDRQRLCWCVSLPAALQSSSGLLHHRDLWLNWDISWSRRWQQFIFDLPRGSCWISGSWPPLSWCG